MINLYLVRSIALLFLLTHHLLMLGNPLVQMVCLLDFSLREVASEIVVFRID